VKKSILQIIIILVTLCSMQGFAQKGSGTASESRDLTGSPYYHYTPDGKAFFELSGQKILIKFQPQISFEEQSRILSKEQLLLPLTKEMALPAPKVLLAELRKGATEKQILELVERLNQVASIEFANPFLIYNDGTSEAALDRFIVKLNNRSDFSEMQKLVSEYGASIDEQYKYDENLYFIKVGKASKMRALEMANAFSETKLFAAAEPDVLKLLKRYNT
jgi:hypothetical protein